MNLSRRGRLVAIACSAALLLAVSCSNPAAGSPSGGNPGGSGSTAIDFESGYDTAAVSASEANVQGGTMGMAFALDSTLFNTGASSLKVTGTSRQNAWSTDFFGEAQIDLGSTFDFGGRTISVSAYLPAGSKVTDLNLTLLDATGKQSMFVQQSLTPGQWTPLSFSTAGVTWNYQDPGASIASVNAIRFRFLTSNAGTPASVPVSVSLDTLKY